MYTWHTGYLVCILWIRIPRSFICGDHLFSSVSFCQLTKRFPLSDPSVCLSSFYFFILFTVWHHHHHQVEVGWCLYTSAEGRGMRELRGWISSPAAVSSRMPQLLPLSLCLFHFRHSASSSGFTDQFRTRSPQPSLFLLPVSFLFHVASATTL